MATYFWTATSGTAFDAPADWSPGAVPGIGDTAQFSRGSGGTITGVGDPSALAFSAGNWILLGQLGADTTSLESAAVTIAGAGQLVLNNGLSVAQASQAWLFVSGGRLVVSGPSTFGYATLQLSNQAIAQFAGTLALGDLAATTATVDGSALLAGSVVQLGTASGASGAVTLKNGAEMVVTAGADTSVPYLQLGAAAGATGSVSVVGSGSELIVSSNSGAVGLNGVGYLGISGRGLARFYSSNNGTAPALQIGQSIGSNGTVAVTDAGSSLQSAGSIRVGTLGTGTLRVLNGATASSSSVTAEQAALSVASFGGSSGTLVIDGAGSSLSASGAAVIGGDDRGSGLIGGGSGSVTLSNGGVLVSGTMTVLGGGSVSVDGSSALIVSGNLLDYGQFSSAGTLSVGGGVAGSGVLTLGGGIATLGGLASAHLALASSSAIVRIGTLSGPSTISGLTYGAVVELVGQQATLTGNVLATSTGSLTLSGTDPSLVFTAASDGNGGTVVAIGADTIGVYRFFDSIHGTHFFTADPSEEASIIASRPDLLYEGVGLQAVDPNSHDPNAAPVFRFFDTRFGTHFYTADASERDTVIATRSDLSYEGVGFVEHTTQQAGDVPVYRFFDANFGTHFYSADATEKATIQATRPDLVYEGIGFYAPA